MGLFNFMKRKSANKAIFCGLDNSGKSTIISFLKEGKFVEHTPTMGKNQEDLIVKGTKLSIVDLGGQSHFRKLWTGELSKDTKCVVFVIDRADPKRFAEAKEEIDKIIPIVKKNNLKFLLFANKSDIATAVSIEEIYDQFDLSSLGSFEILELSAKTGFGIVNAFMKFYTALTGEKIKRNVVASAISIYNTGGIPLVTQTKNDDEFNEKAIEGGFLSAITSFAQNKIGGSAIKFETETGDMFIVRKSDKFIGALLWKKELSVPVEESEDALRELLNHLESCVPNGSGYEEHVEFYLNQYATNML